MRNRKEIQIIKNSHIKRFPGTIFQKFQLKIPWNFLNFHIFLKKNSEFPAEIFAEISNGIFEKIGYLEIKKKKTEIPRNLQLEFSVSASTEFFHVGWKN